MKQIIRLLTLAAIVLPVHSLPAVAATRTAASEQVIYCWDRARGIVQEKRRRTCNGAEVSAEQAFALKTRYEKARRAHLVRGDALRRAEAARPVRFHSAGTAFAVSSDGFFLTSAHVVAKCHAVEMRVPGSQRRLATRVVAVDAKNDLALVRAAYRPKRFLLVAPVLPRNGEPLALIGFPQEGKIRLTPRLTPVNIDYTLSNPEKRGLIGVVGDVRRGNSGGPALDSKGRVVGVVKAKIDSVQAARLTGTTLKHLGVVTEAREMARFLKLAKSKFAIDTSRGIERTLKELFTIGEAATVRIDCLHRNKRNLR